jgi:hypothetical protein
MLMTIDMQTLNPHIGKKRQPSKGKRLSWTPVVDVKSINLCGANVIGKVVDVKDYLNEGRDSNKGKSSFIIP